MQKLIPRNVLNDPQPRCSVSIGVIAEKSQRISNYTGIAVKGSL